MRSGQCPKCGGDAIYACQDHATSLAPLWLSLVTTMESELQSYLCVGCGYTEVYCGAAKLIDSGFVANTVVTDRHWKRIDTPATHHEFAECPKCGARLRGKRRDCTCGAVMTKVR